MLLPQAHLLGATIEPTPMQIALRHRLRASWEWEMHRTFFPQPGRRARGSHGFVSPIRPLEQAFAAFTKDAGPGLPGSWSQGFGKGFC